MPYPKLWPLAVAALFGTFTVACANDLTVGAIYVGAKDDYGYNQAHALGIASLKGGMPGVKVIEEASVPETVAVQQTMKDMINQDGATVLFPTSAWMVLRPPVNDIAVGIAMIIFGTGLAFFLGKPFIQPVAPHLPAWRPNLPGRLPPLDVCPLFFPGAALAFGLQWFFGSTRPGLAIRAVGDKPDAARAMSVSDYLFNASPFFLTLLVMVLTCSNERSLAGAPGALGKDT